MRRAALLLLAASLFATSATAADITSSTPTFGRATCGPAFACPTSLDTETNRGFIVSLANRANNCVGTYFGMSTPGGFFEETYGLDSSRCLTTKRLPKAESGLTMIPKCCVVPVSNDGAACQIACSQYGTR